LFAKDAGSTPAASTILNSADPITAPAGSIFAGKE